MLPEDDDFWPDGDDFVIENLCVSVCVCVCVCVCLSKCVLYFSPNVMTMF